MAYKDQLIDAANNRKTGMENAATQSTNVQSGNTVTPTSSQQGNTRTATYIDSSGKRKKGVTQNTNSNSGTLSYWEGISNDYQSMYDEAIAANDAAAASAAKRAQEAADENIASLKESYASTNKQLYRDYMDNQKALPQYLAAQGYTGGATESSWLNLANAYEESLNENASAQTSGIREINSSLAQQLYEAEAAKAQANAEAKQTLLNNQILLKQSQREEKYAEAELRASMGDFSGYLELGYSAQTVAYLEEIWKLQNADLFEESTTSSGTTAKKDTYDSIVADAKTALSGGDGTLAGQIIKYGVDNGVITSAQGNNIVNNLNGTPTYGATSFKNAKTGS